MKSVKKTVQEANDIESVSEMTVSELMKHLCKNKKRALALNIVKTINEIDGYNSDVMSGCGQPSTADLLELMIEG